MPHAWSSEAEHLPEAVARLAVTSKDRASARQALLTLLAVQAPRKAERYVRASIKLGEDSEFLGFLSYFHLERARLEFSRGEWDKAVRLAEDGLDAHMPTRCSAGAAVLGPRPTGGLTGFDRAWIVVLITAATTALAGLAVGRAARSGSATASGQPMAKEVC